MGGFLNALSAISPLAPAQQDAQDIRTQRATAAAQEADRAEAARQAAQLKGLEIQQEPGKAALETQLTQQAINKGNQPTIIGQPEWDSTKGKYTVLALDPTKGLTRIDAPGGESPAQKGTESVNEYQDVYSRAVKAGQTPEIANAIAAATTGIKIPLTEKDWKPIIDSGMAIGMTSPEGKTYYDRASMPPDAQKEFDLIRKDYAQHEQQLESRAEAASDRTAERQSQAMLNAMNLGDYRNASKQLDAAKQTYVSAAQRLRTMEANRGPALAGDQQAMLSLVANHIGMTLGAQKGARINQAVWNEAVESAPWLQRAGARFNSNGFLSGVALTPGQVDQMIGLGKQMVQTTGQTVKDTQALYAQDLALNPRQKAADNVPSAPSGPPAGATMKVPGSDGKLHWSDGKRDLGVAQ